MNMEEEKKLNNEEIENVSEVSEQLSEEEVEQLDEQPVENEKFSFPILGVVIIGALIVIIAVLIILLYAFGGPLPKE